LGFQDETWWSRYETPRLHAWAEPDQALRLVQQPVPKKEPDPKALACYGLLVSCPADAEWQQDQVWLRFVDGRPVSAITTQFLAWSCDKLEAAGKRALLLIWDNASWHISKAVRHWIREHNREVKRSGRGVRILACYLPTKSPWLNAIEPHWMHAKRHIAEPDGTLSAEELRERVCTYFGCTHEPHISIPEEIA
jgi:transposase